MYNLQNAITLVYPPLCEFVYQSALIL